MSEKDYARCLGRTMRPNGSIVQPKPGSKVALPDKACPTFVLKRWAALPTSASPNAALRLEGVELQFAGDFCREFLERVGLAARQPAGHHRDDVRAVELLDFVD